MTQEIFKDYYSLDTMHEVIVVQMGKVGSTSVVESLKAYNIHATQCHFITKEAILKIIDNFIICSKNEQTAFHSIVQCFVNTILLNKIYRYKEQDNGIQKKRLKFISMTRDPLTWYFSNLSQNFHEYKDDISAYVEKKIEATEEQELEEIIYIFVKDVLNLYKDNVDKVDINSMADYRRLATHYSQNKKMQLVIRQFWILMRPHLWFQTHLDPLLDNPVFNETFDHGKGYIITNGSYYDMLIFRFEDIKMYCEMAIKEFLKIDTFNLNHLNESKDSSVGKVVNQVRDRLFSEFSLNDLYVESDYMRKFYSYKFK